MVSYRIMPENIPNTGILFANHEKAGRSGHLSHALAEYAPGHIIAFYSNCSGTRNKWAPGHNGFGWLEYRRSADGGRTWDAPGTLDYSMNCLLNEPYTVSCEKAVSPAENVILAFCIRNENPNGWEPYLEPVTLISRDGGDTWEEPRQFCSSCGRIYDAFVRDGAVYVFMLAFNDFLTASPEHRYHVYRSTDGGEHFELLSEIPGDYLHHAYGSAVVRDDGAFIFYSYNADDEYRLDYWISHDRGVTWSEQGKSYCAKRIRNPQVAKVRGGYILHGRAGCMSQELPMHFVLYTGEDGIHWDEGVYICASSNGTAYYSNNLVLNEPDGTQRVLIQSSVPYDGGRVNIAHWWLEMR